jgi:hypothetical protein
MSDKATNSVDEVHMIMHWANKNKNTTKQNSFRDIYILVLHRDTIGD